LGIVNKQLEQLFRKELTRKEFINWSALLIVSMFGVGGVLETLRSHAATPEASEEAEKGTLTGPAQIINDSSASGGEAVAFGQAAVGPIPSDLSETPPAPWPSGSIFTSLIPISPTLASNSATLVTAFAGNIKDAGSTGPGLNAYTFTPTRYEVHSSVTPTVPLTITGNGVGTPTGTMNIPIPSGAISDSTSLDDEMVIWDLDTQTVWEIYRAKYSSTTGLWSANCAATSSTATGNGVFTRSGLANTCSASGISYLGSQITARDLKAGVIKHAIACAIPQTANFFVAPAKYHDGNNTTADAIPEGTRMFFPKTVTMPSGLGTLAQMVFVAIQTYGMYILDTSGSVSIYGENSTAWTHAGQANIYTGLIANYYGTFHTLPWSQLEVLAVPE
jgi:hypothetical protein